MSTPENDEKRWPAKKLEKWWCHGVLSSGFGAKQKEAEAGHDQILGREMVRLQSQSSQTHDNAQSFSEYVADQPANPTILQSPSNPPLQTSTINPALHHQALEKSRHNASTAPSVKQSWQPPGMKMTIAYGVPVYEFDLWMASFDDSNLDAMPFEQTAWWTLNSHRLRSINRRNSRRFNIKLMRRTRWKITIDMIIDLQDVSIHGINKEGWKRLMGRLRAMLERQSFGTF